MTTTREADARRGPIDSRLWRCSKPARRYLVSTVVLSVVAAAATIVTAVCVGSVLAGTITDANRRTLSSWSIELTVLVAALAVRVAATWAQSRFGERAAASVVADLETRVVAVGANLSPRELDSRRDDLAVVVTRGLDDLRHYLAGYLPALVSAVVVPPIVLAVIAYEDLVSAAIIAGTVPLIPLFMVLIGLLTKQRSAAGLAALTRLSSQLLDLLAGLPTLRALGREQGPARRIRRLGEAHRRSAMATLRVAFLSSFVLELLATLCVALVAVSIGLRLVFGEMSLAAGIIALVLAPEVYQPLRAVGAKFHAAADGLAAVDLAFELLDNETRPATQPRAASCGQDIELRHVTVRARSGSAPFDVTATLRPGRTTVVAGPNGAGKSTLLQVILGLIEPDEGTVRIGGTDIGGIDTEDWWSRVAWLPQRPVLVPGTLRENLELTGSVGFGTERLARACAATGFDRVLDELQHRWATVVGAGGIGLSLGQRQRLALTRILATDRPVLLLDEPTAHLDSAAEARVLAALERRAADGATVVVVGHRPAVLATADDIIEVSSRA